jgi:hypothetical protein
MSSSDFHEGPERRGRPGALTAICVLAIVFGALGLLGGVAGLASQLFSSRIQEAVVAGQAGATGPAADIRKDMITRTTEITKKYSPIMIPLAIVKILVEGALLVGGILALGFKPSGRSLLAGVLLAALILDAIQFVPTFMAQREAQAVAAELMPQIMAAQTGPNSTPMPFDMSSMMSGIGTITLVLGLAWLAVKIVLYILGMRYLKRPDVMALFPLN